MFQISTGCSSEYEISTKIKNVTKIDKKIYLTILKFSFGIIFSITLLGVGKLILFSKKIIPANIIKIITILIAKLNRLELLDLVFLYICIYL